MHFLPGQGSGNRGTDRAHDLAARSWPVAAAMHHPAITTRAITSQIISLTYQMVNLIRAEIRNPFPRHVAKAYPGPSCTSSPTTTPPTSTRTCSAANKQPGRRKARGIYTG